jgi:hypothetical protein
MRYLNYLENKGQLYKRTIDDGKKVKVEKNKNKKIVLVKR